MMLAAPAAVAERIGRQPLHVRHQAGALSRAAAAVVVCRSRCCSPRRAAPRAARLRRGAVLIGGDAGRRHRDQGRAALDLSGLSLQPSEFLKPFFAVVAAWAGRRAARAARVRATLLAIVLLLGRRAPAEGAARYRHAAGRRGVCFAQFFVAGLNLVLVGLGGRRARRRGRRLLHVPAVRSRVDRFLDPPCGDNYQVQHRARGLREWRLLGRGPGEGRVKNVLPDAHADFVFAVAGEEFGMVVCLVILCAVRLLVLRGLSRCWRRHDLFVVLAATGLLTQFGLQAFVNMASIAAADPDQGHDAAASSPMAARRCSRSRSAWACCWR